MITGWKQLTKAERKHLAKNGIVTNADWERTRIWQRDHPGINGHPVCFECEAIARKIRESLEWSAT